MQLEVHGATTSLWDKHMYNTLVFPQMNGVNERNHATVDIMVRKILDDNPEKTLQQAVNEATFAKNAQITAKGFSPFHSI